MTGHLDLDALADALAGDAHDDGHLATCSDCTAAIEELRNASDATALALHDLPRLVMPADVAAQLHDALREAPSAGSAAPGATLTTLPPARSRPDRLRWLSAAAAVVVVLAGAAYGLSRLGGTGGEDTTAAGKASAAPLTAELDLVRNSSGADYTDRASLAAAMPQLLAGTAPARDAVAAQAPPAPAGAAGVNSGAPRAATADPLARLRDNAGLADCLLALLPPDDASVRPLAIDYASYHDTPALVVVLPSSLPKKLDVFVVGAGCSQANDSTLFYASVDRP